jgi:hypothetical protein
MDADKCSSSSSGSSSSSSISSSSSSGSGSSSNSGNSSNIATVESYSVPTGLPCATGVCLHSTKTVENGTRLCAWEALTNELLWTHTVQYRVHFWRYSPDATKAVVVMERCQEKVVTVVDLCTHTATEFILGQSNAYRFVTMQVNGVGGCLGNKLFVFGPVAPKVEVWNLELGIKLFATDVALSVSIIGDGQKVALCTPNEILVWDSDTGNEVTRLHISSKRLNQFGNVILVSCDGDQQLCGYYLSGHHFTTEIWDMRTEEKVFHQDMTITTGHVCSTSRGPFFLGLVRGAPYHLICWRITDGEMLYNTALPVESHLHWMWSFECCQQRETLYVLTSTVLEYDISSGVELARSSEYTDEVVQLHVANYMNILM